MANLTLSIDDDLLRRARIRALEQGTSVNAVVRSFLHTYADVGARAAAIGDFLEIAAASSAGSNQSERTWRRSELYSERFDR